MLNSSVLRFLLTLVFLGIVVAFEIKEPEEYEPKVIPQNVPEARKALNYDKYASQPVKSSQVVQKFPYGNNWEQFGAPEIHYNFGYKQ